MVEEEKEKEKAKNILRKKNGLEYNTYFIIHFMKIKLF
jgi:hypothetical protein